MIPKIPALLSLCLAVNVSLASAAVDDSQAGQLRCRGELGATLAAPTAGKPGAEVRTVSPGSPAERAGLKAGDRILEVGGAAIGDGIAMQTALAALRADDSVQLAVLRDSQVVAIRFMPAEVPRERVDGIEIAYGSVVSDRGHRVRTIV